VGVASGAAAVVVVAESFELYEDPPEQPATRVRTPRTRTTALRRRLLRADRIWRSLGVLG
jgi:hypothetical protein